MSSCSSCSSTAAQPSIQQLIQKSLMPAKTVDIASEIKAVVEPDALKTSGDTGRTLNITA